MFHVLKNLPPEEPRVEREGGSAIAGHKLAPAKLARLARVVQVHHVAGRLENRQKCTLRIGNHGESTHRRNVLGPVVDLAAQLLDQCHRGVDLFDLDVPHPMRRRSHLGRLLGQLDHAAERALTANPHGVIAALSERLRLPTDDVAVEGDRRLGILGEELVPDESAVVRVCHDESSLSATGRVRRFRRRTGRGVTRFRTGHTLRA